MHPGSKNRGYGGGLLKKKRLPRMRQPFEMFVFRSALLDVRADYGGHLHHVDGLAFLDAGQVG
jgi:hypothetical protein